MARQPFLMTGVAVMRCSKETVGCILGSHRKSYLELGREVLLVKREEKKKKKRGKTNSSSHIYIDRMYGLLSHLGPAAKRSMHGYSEREGFLPCLPGPICVKEETGITQRAIFMLEKWQRGCSKFTLL